MELTWEIILTCAGAVGVIAGAWLTIQKIKEIENSRKEKQHKEILDAAKIEMTAKEAILDAKIKAVDERVENLEKSVEKDLAHIRETYNGEIRNLGQKIEELRSELRNQHGSLVQLLTKLIDNTKD